MPFFSEKKLLKSIKLLILQNKVINLLIIKPFKYFTLIESRFIIYLSKKSHKRLRFSNWSLGTTKNWFDHQIDKNYQWEEKGDCSWLERGVFSSICLQKNSRVLELCSGDGFHAANFYSNKCHSIVCCDIDNSAIMHAKKYYQKKNIIFLQRDIINNMPDGEFDNIIWDIAFSFSEVFNKKQLDKIFFNIKKRLNKNGVLSGCTLLLNENIRSNLKVDSYPLNSKKDLLNLLSKSFKYIHVFEVKSIYRNSLYFWCSEEENKIPFSRKSNLLCTNFDK